VVEASGGQLSIVGAGRNTDLNRLLTDSDPQLRASTQYVERWGASSPEVFFQDVGLSPDLPTVGAVAADLYEQATGLSIEGVVTLDPYAMQALLTLTGPVSAGGLRLDASNVVPYILVDQYNEFEGDEAGREAALGALVTAAFDALTGTSLPGPRALADALGPVVEQDRLGVWWKAGGPVAELTALTGLDNAFPLANGDDLIGLVHQNAGQNKIDVYLQRRWTYTAEVDDGSVSATLLAEFINDAPGTGLSAAVIGSNDQGFDFGTNVALVHVHTALDLVEARIDGQVVVPTRQAAFDGEAIGVTLEIPPGASVTLEVSLQGQVNGDYQLHLVQQPLVNPDTVSVDVTTDGEQSIFVVDEVLEQDLVLENGG